MRRAVPILAIVAWLVPSVAAVAALDREKAVFPVPEATAVPAAPGITKTYWRVHLDVRVGPSSEPASLRLPVPLSDGRQTVLRRSAAAEGFTVVEKSDGANLRATWQRPPSAETSSVQTEIVVEVADLSVAPPTRPLPVGEPPPELVLETQPTGLIQSADPEIRRRARELTRAAKRVDEAIWALYQYTASFLKSDLSPQPPGRNQPSSDAASVPESLPENAKSSPGTAAQSHARNQPSSAVASVLESPRENAKASLGPSSDEALDALSVLRAEKGSGTGKARVLTAFLRSLGIPARMVGGLRLADAKRTKSTISWVEAWTGESWFPIDPAGGNFGFVPNNYLVLYRGDLPLLVHKSGIEVSYEFVVRQVTRKATVDPEGEPERSVLEVLDRSAPASEEGRVSTVASYVAKPVATVVVISDAGVPEAVIERMRSEATAERIDLVILLARFPSRYFRENYLQHLVATNVAAVREAHLLLVATQDTAGLYSLLALGERKVALTDARVVVTGSFASPVGRILGTVLYELLDPGELAVYSQPADLLSLWEVAKGNLLRGEPIVEASRAWGMEPAVINETSIASLSAYRQLVVRGWARAVRAQVPLQALNLILVIPIIACVVVVFRNVIGLETFGTFSPVIVSLAFLATGLAWGLVIFVSIVGLGSLLRNAIQGLRLHLVARLSILVSLVALVMTGLTVLGAYLGIGALLQVSLFPMVIMSNLIENFTASQIEFGTRQAARIAANTLVVSATCCLLVEETGLPSVLLAFPELLLLVIVAEVALGKWRGLRLTEYHRFYALLRRTRPEPRP